MIGLMIASVIALATDVPMVNCASQAEAQILSSIRSVEHGWRIVTTTGHSMLPRIGNPAILLVADIPYTEIQPRVIVLRNHRKAARFMSCHRVIAQHGEGWTTKGDNLARADPDFLNAANYRGTVAMIFNFPRP